MRLGVSILLTLVLTIAAATGSACRGTAHASAPAPADSLACDSVLMPSIASWRAEMKAMAEADKDSRYTTLTEADYRVIADELGVEVAAIKAVVRIEAGASLQGFLAPGVPVVNFDRSMYSRARSTTNVRDASATVPSGITHAHGRNEWKQLVAARRVNRDKANMGTFWGMFQIGGFNYKLCGCDTVQEFVERMSYSEFEQLQLFANFIKNTGMVDDLRAKNWAAFARKYNGSSYRARGYHTRMADAYRKYKAEEKQ